MRIALTGATGFIGSAIARYLSFQDHSVIQITRRESLTSPYIAWDPIRGLIEAEKLENLDAVIHLAGANISERWTPAYKKMIASSRIEGTRLLCQSLAKLHQKPRILICASAIGFYGNHEPDKILTESSPSGEGFLPEVCRQWEDETRYAKEAGIRVVNIRLGVVLGKSGGAMAKMLPIFNLGLGGVLGSGKQMMSWIALLEIPYIIEHLIKHESISGPVNVVSPNPVSNREFTKTLGNLIKRPAFLPVPSFGIKALFAEMGETLLLEGARVIPERLQKSGYQFRYPMLKSALESVLNP